eukprot:TRINITY_DN14172_c0_g3_i2.p2 TRINITY_DN14172_c0_g3~~TRINITY_DN14172_c0_g3_i2.p2  ORF type:complete len:182 (+),score=18.67 TRINITY_DN14172_c0_g3_i2:24-548(+)
MIRRPPRSTHCISSAASDVYKRQAHISTDGNIHLLLKLSWTNIDSGILYQRLMPNGTVIREKVVVEAERHRSIPCETNPVQVSDDGTHLVMVYRAAIMGDPDLQLLLKESLDGGETWSGDKVVSNNIIGKISGCTVLLEKDTGRVYVFYTSSLSIYGTVCYNFSCHQGARKRRI